MNSVEITVPTTPERAAELPAPTLRRRRGRDHRPRAGRRIPRGMRGPIALSILPGLLLYLTFFVVPLVVLAVTSLANWSGLGFHFLGVQNFTRMFHDPAFWTATQNTMLYVAVGVFLQVPLGVVAGIVLSLHVPGWRVFRALLFIPFVISGAAYALVFSLFFNPRYGLLNKMLGLVGLNHGHDWLFSTSTALLSVAGTFVFILGLVMVLVMAEIAAIPTELYEAAQMDGASALQRQLRITVPLLRNVIGTIVLITVLEYLGLFDIVFILTKGGPNNTTLTLVLYAYQSYVNNAWGYASAAGIVIILFGLVLIVAIRRLFRVGERTL